MNRRKWTLSFGVVVCLVALATPATAQDWEEESSGPGWKIHSKEMKDSGVAMLRGTMTLPYTVEEVAAVLTDIEKHDTFMPGLKKVKILSEEKNKKGHHIQYVYQVSSVPVINDRDAVLYTETWSETNKAGAVTWKSKFHAVHDRGPKPTDDMVRIQRLSGRWTISPTKSGKARFVYYCHAEGGGSVPDFLVQNGQVSFLEGVLSGLKKRTRKLAKK